MTRPLVTSLADYLKNMTKHHFRLSISCHLAGGIQASMILLLPSVTLQARRSRVCVGFVIVRNGENILQACSNINSTLLLRSCTHFFFWCEDENLWVKRAGVGRIKPLSRMVFQYIHINFKPFSSSFLLPVLIARSYFCCFFWREKNRISVPKA